MKWVTFNLWCINVILHYFHPWRNLFSVKVILSQIQAFSNHFSYFFLFFVSWLWTWIFWQGKKGLISHRRNTKTDVFRGKITLEELGPMPTKCTEFESIFLSPCWYTSAFASDTIISDIWSCTEFLSLILNGAAEEFWSSEFPSCKFSKLTVHYFIISTIKAFTAIIKIVYYYI